jgi:hypothetical protein
MSDLEVQPRRTATTWSCSPAVRVTVKLTVDRITRAGVHETDWPWRNTHARTVTEPGGRPAGENMTLTALARGPAALAFTRASETEPALTVVGCPGRRAAPPAFAELTGPTIPEAHAVVVPPAPDART